MVYTRERLGELLFSAGVITSSQLEGALADQARGGGKLGEVLVRTGVLDEEAIARTLAAQKGLEYVDLDEVAVDRVAASEISERLARRHRVIPIAYQGEGIVLAMSDPLDVEAMDDVRIRTGRSVVPVVATGAQIAGAIQTHTTAADALVELGFDVWEEAAEEPIVTGDDDVPVVRLVNQLIREAVFEGASDIHIEPAEKVVHIRFRVDGVLREVMEVPITVRAGLISRVKVMAEMDIAERRRPQDGRIAVVVEERPIDMRIATLPTPGGESVVMRILNQDSIHLSLEDLGMTGDELTAFEDFLAHPYGEVLISGPTGSGKTTTLYAGLMRLDRPSRKIITIEDPIEYRMTGITQMGVHPAIGSTFAQLLRTVLRSDPDVVMVGEIRDPETAEIATRAALTGHLVLSSIHTNDAPSALTRLVDMDVAPYVASSAIIGVVAQRLVRKLCENCRERVRAPKPALAAAGFSVAELGQIRVFAAREDGCSQCRGTGYRGRTGVFEIMRMNDELRELFLASASTDVLRAAAITAGMKTLRENALEKIVGGTTSLTEVRRVIV